MRKLAAILLLCLVGATHGISYTVQVAAVSDQESALTLVRNLLRDGYPAYFVRTTTEAGFVFRIRVGAFQNRGAALRYAEAMPSVAGARPIPALAEAIPAGIMPLAPALLLTVDLADRTGELVPWGATVAFRAQPTDPLVEASYYVLDENDPVPFRAWLAALQEDGTAVRVRNLPLWPDATGEGEDAPAVRSEFAAQLRGLIATQLGVEAAVVDEAQFEMPGGAPALVVVERFQPNDPESGELVGLGDPAAGMGPYGPTTFVVGSDAAPTVPVPEVRFDAGTGAEDATAATEAVTGGTWTATADAGFARLEAEGASWRAAVGVPVWASDGLLVTRSAGVLLIYRFEARPLEDAN